MPPFSSREKESLKRLRKLLTQIEKEPSRKALKQSYLACVKDLSSGEKQIQWYLYLAQVYYRRYPKEALKLALRIKKIDPDHQLASRIIKRVNSITREGSSHSRSSSLQSLSSASRSSRRSSLPSRQDQSKRMFSSTHGGHDSSAAQIDDLQATMVGDPQPHILEEASQSSRAQKKISTLSQIRLASSDTADAPLQEPDSLAYLAKHLGRVHDATTPPDSPETVAVSLPSNEVKPQKAEAPMPRHKLPLENTGIFTPLGNSTQNKPPLPADPTRISPVSQAADHANTTAPTTSQVHTASSTPHPSLSHDAKKKGEQHILQALSHADEKTLGKILVQAAPNHSHTTWWQKGMNRLIENSKSCPPQTKQPSDAASPSVQIQDYCLNLLSSCGKHHLVLDILATIARLRTTTPPQHLRHMMLQYYLLANRQLGRKNPQLKNQEEQALSHDDQLEEWRSMLQTTAPRDVEGRENLDASMHSA